MKKVILLSLLLISLATPNVIHAQSSDLLINPESDPLFNETNWVPGASVSKTITVTNLSETDTYMFGVATFDEQDVDELASQLKLEIIDQYGVILYGTAETPKTLANLFEETEYSTVPGKGTELNLTILPPQDTNIITIRISFPEESGNEWQDTETVFSFGMGYTGSILGEQTTAEKIVKEVGDILGATGQTTTWAVILGGMTLLGLGVIGIVKKNKKWNNPTKPPLIH